VAARPHTETMSGKFTILLAFAAGITGGLASRYSTASVYAQPPAVPQEIRAHEFVLVDEAGAVRGAFGVETNGAPEIEVSDSKGHVMAYRAEGWTAVHGLLSGGITGPRHATLVPAKP
jgi:hypothetical protein